MSGDALLLSTWWFGLPANAAGIEAARRADGVLDALERTCVSCELDLSCDSVGVGGLPDASGEVSLDGAVMLSPARSAGVAYVRRYAHPVSIARRVMERTVHKLLVGEGAERFAAAQGFKEAKLLTEAARRKWEEWKRTGAYRDFHVGELDAPPPQDAPRSGRTEGAPFTPEDSHDTIGVLGVDAAGTIGAACSTSGRAFKLPGRVGDSPLIGPGLYCDPRAGAAVATGTGELMIGVAASFLVVERMRGGDSPLDAVKYVLGRVAESYPALAEKDQCALIALRPSGAFASGALRGGFQVAVTTGAGRHELVAPEVVLST
jgi:isoaspartyl peptidase/L-asparaginase-like protein (Ntn-hydrolase superfamily)